MATKKSTSKSTKAPKAAAAPKFGSPAFNKLHGIGQFGKKAKGGK